jgi:H+-translocating NAD(P) transhydrogenase subunit beta
MMLIDILYVIAAILFILGLKQITKVKTAKKGNKMASIGMFLAVLTTLFKMHLDGKGIGTAYIIAGIVIGGFIGAILSKRVKMTEMPELVAVFNGFGGLASLLVALSYAITSAELLKFDLVTVILSLIIGAVTFAGSIVAFLKLRGVISSRPMVFKGNNILNIILFIVIIALSLKVISTMALGINLDAILIIIFIGTLLGVLLVTPIGGADMPIVISLLNSYSGLAASAAGFVLKNNVLIISGALVGASGLILTSVMCKAMNRSLVNVLFGGFGQVQQTHGKQKEEYHNVKETSSEEAALILESASSVIIVPGYGLAVAQAQFVTHELEEELEKRGIKVKYGIHPVAGRMPGHMNVLLAEANVSYDKLFDLDHINNEFKNTDVVIIAGANDVVNPAAASEKSSPIYGMPVLKVNEARSILIIKRSLSPGFAGIKNKLFEHENAKMLFGDAKQIMHQLVQEVGNLD